MHRCCRHAPPHGTDQPCFEARTLLLLLLLGTCLYPARPGHAAQNDNNIEWDGVYSDETFRSPRFPVRGQSFAVDLRVFRGDISAARVRTWDGAEHQFNMFWVRNEGIHDIWRANVSGT